MEPGDRFCVAVQWHPETAADVGLLAGLVRPRPRSPRDRARLTGCAMTVETDVLGAPYTAETIALPADDEGEVVATLVHRPAEAPTAQAVLHVHGFADYFFQTEYAEWWTARGYDFYALDLRKYGRSLRDAPDAQLRRPTWREYFAELDAAWHRITERDGHDHVVLTRALDRRADPAAVGQRAAARRAGRDGAQLARGSTCAGSPLLRTARHRGDQPVRRRASRCARSRARSPASTPAACTATTRASGTSTSAWKPIESWPVYAGWLRAIRRGHAQLHARPRRRVPGARAVARAARPAAARWATTCTATTSCSTSSRSVGGRPALGRHVTMVAVDDARHDVVLSPPEVRARVYDEMARWLTAYVDIGSRS